MPDTPSFKFGDTAYFEGGDVIYIGESTEHAPFHLFYREDGKGWHQNTSCTYINPNLLNKIVAAGFESSLWWVLPAELKKRGT